MTPKASRAASILLAEAREDGERKVILAEQLAVATSTLRACVQSVFCDVITPTVLADARSAIRQAGEAIEQWERE